MASFVVVYFTICVVTTPMGPTIYMAVATFGGIRGVSLSVRLWLWYFVCNLLKESQDISICVLSGCFYLGQQDYSGLLISGRGGHRHITSRFLHAGYPVRFVLRWRLFNSRSIFVIPWSARLERSLISGRGWRHHISSWVLHAGYLV